MGSLALTLGKGWGYREIGTNGKVMPGGGGTLAPTFISFMYLESETWTEFLPSNWVCTYCLPFQNWVFRSYPFLIALSLVPSLIF
jgi:hypothetical protein